MIQIGQEKDSPGQSEDCGTGIVGIEVERYKSGSYYCTAFPNDDAPGLVAVALGSNGWGAYFNSNLIDGPFNFGGSFNNGYAIARAEAAWNSTPPGVDWWWGASGQVNWQYKTASVGYKNLPAPPTTHWTQTLSDPEWDCGNGPPNPFDIKRLTGFQCM